MRTDITKKQFVELCDALEENKITLEQFKVLGDTKPFHKAYKILEIMKMEGVTNKQELFDKLIILSSDDVHQIERIFKRIPVYRSDEKRQQYLFENVQYGSLELLARILKYDFYFEDKDFLKKVEEVLKEPDFYKNLRTMEMLIERDREDFDRKEVQELSKRALVEIKNDSQIESFMEIIKIEGLSEEKIWIDYLIKMHEKVASDPYPYYRRFDYELVLEKLAYSNRLNSATKKLREIDEEEKEEEKKLAIFEHFIEKLWLLTDEELGEDCKEEHINYLLNEAKDIKVSRDDFYNTKEIIKIAQKKNLTLEQIIKTEEMINKIEWENVQSLVLDLLRNEDALINEEILVKLEKSSYEEARLILTKKAMKQNAEGYIKSSKEYYGEGFNRSFIEYLNREDITKEELLSLKDKIQMFHSNFDEKTQKFVVDTSSIVEEKLEELVVDTSTSSTKDAKKGFIKSLVRKFAK